MSSIDVRTYDRQMDFVDISRNSPRIPEAFGVLHQLRTSLDEATFRSIIETGHDEGLRFTAAYEDEACVAVAGWRILNSTNTIRKLYVDDLVTDSRRRSAGYGSALLRELERRAKEAGCHVLDLDSGVQRADAHRFYFREQMNISSFHFVKRLI